MSCEGLDLPVYPLSLIRAFADYVRGFITYICALCLLMIQTMRKWVLPVNGFPEYARANKLKYCFIRFYCVLESVAYYQNIFINTVCQVVLGRLLI